jgi:hypothetical protein
MGVDVLRDPFTVMTAGGVLRRIERALGITRGSPGDWRRRAVAYAAIVYAPLLLIGVMARLTQGAWPPPLASILTHTRALVTIPLLLVAEELIDQGVRGVVPYLLRANLVDPADHERLRRLVRGAGRLRDTEVAEATVAILTVASILEGFSIPSLAVPAHWWSAVPGLLVLRFLLLRLLWHWFVWALFLWRLSRMPLRLVAMHPDRVGGLGALMDPSLAFGVIAGAASTTMAAGWADALLRGEAVLVDLVPVAVTQVLLMELLALAPLLPFSVRLVAARIRDTRAYGALASRHTQAFGERWLERTGEDLLGAPDVSSQCDLGTNFTVVSSSRIAVWSPKLVTTIALAAVAPMTPLVLFEMSLADFVFGVVKAIAT